MRQQPQVYGDALPLGVCVAAAEGCTDGLVLAPGELVGDGELVADELAPGAR